jgi:hypothetical protein
MSLLTISEDMKDSSDLSADSLAFLTLIESVKELKDLYKVLSDSANFRSSPAFKQVIEILSPPKKPGDLSKFELLLGFIRGSFLSQFFEP